MSAKVFCGSAALLFGLTVFANWPRDLGTLKRHLVQAGCPRTFAFWEAGELKTFDVTPLSIDLAIAVSLVLAFSWVLARSASRMTRQLEQTSESR